MSALIYQTH